MNVQIETNREWHINDLKSSHLADFADSCLSNLWIIIMCFAGLTDLLFLKGISNTNCQKRWYVWSELKKKETSLNCLIFEKDSAGVKTPGH